jgi:hypothetical protein
LRECQYLQKEFYFQLKNEKPADSDNQSKKTNGLPICLIICAFLDTDQKDFAEKFFLSQLLFVEQKGKFFANFFEKEGYKESRPFS